MVANRDKVPVYAESLAAFHKAFDAELKGIVDSLPVGRTMRVLDAGCGDGFYTELLAGRLVRPGGVVGLDFNSAFLDCARARLRNIDVRCDVDFLCGSLNEIPKGTFDLIWCAQSLFSLSEPVQVLRQLGSGLRTGGVVAVLENDTFHEILLPWPGELEIAIRSAEFKAYANESSCPSKFYVGRRLPAALAAAGLEPIGFQTQSIDRQTPIEPELEIFLRSYLKALEERVSPYLEKSVRHKMRDWIEPTGSRYMLADPNFTMSWIYVLALGRVSLDAPEQDLAQIVDAKLINQIHKPNYSRY